MTKKRKYTNPKGREISRATCDYSKELPEWIRKGIANANEDETLGKADAASCWIIGIIIGSLITYILYTL